VSADRIARLRATLERELSPVALEIVDDSAKHAGHAGAREGGHFRVALVAEAFRGRSQLERHRIVYTAVAGLMGKDIHALNILARTPEEVA
jgi:BolA family transcriptional regulator, general stress-responsive regulator